MSYGVGLRNGVAFALGTIPSLTSGGGLRPSLLLDFLSGSLDPRITFSRGTQAMQYGSDGTLQYAPNNLLTYSNQADNAAWTKSNSFVQTNLLTFSDSAVANYVTISGAVVNTTPITGFTNSVRFPDNSSTIFAYKSYTVTASTVYTMSAYVQMDDGTAPVLSTSSLSGDLTLVVNNDPAGATNPTVVAVGGGVYRVYVNYTTAAFSGVNIGVAKYNTQSVKGFKVTGLQLVQGSVPGNYQATTSAALPVLYADYNGNLRARKLCEDTANTQHLVSEIYSGGVAGATYTFSAYLAKDTRTKALVAVTDNATGDGRVVVDLVAGTLGTPTVSGNWSNVSATISAPVNGFYRVALTLTKAAVGNTSVVGIVMLYTTTNSYTGDGSSGIYIADAQLTPGYLPLAVTETTSAAVYGPRFDYDPVTKVARGLLIEEQRTNLLLQSNTFNVTWTASANTNVTAVAATSPEGVVNAWRLYASNGLVSNGLIQGISKAAAATQYTWSIYAKPAGYNWIQLAVYDAVADGNRYWFNLSTGVLGSTAAIGAGFTGVSATITNIGNGWYRCTLTATSNAGTQFQSYAYPTNGDGVNTAGDAFTDGTFIYGAQLEAGAFATSYIPTVGSTATRNADSASITTLTPWFNAAAGTLYVQGLHTNIPSSAAMALEIGDGTVNNRHAVFTAGTANCNYYDVVGGVNQATISASTFTANVIGKFSAAYAANDFQVAGNGTLGGSDISGSLPAGLTTMFIGNSIGSTSFWNGWISSIRYYPTRLPNASLQSITV